MKIEWKPIADIPDALKDGRWLLLKGGSIPYCWDGDSLPPLVSAQWSTWLNNQTVAGHWHFAWYDGGYYGGYVDPTHYAEIEADVGGEL